jgi:hypothetical protein
MKSLFQKALSLGLTLSITACQMQVSKNPLISEAKSISIATNVPVDVAWDYSSAPNFKRQPVAGLNLVSAINQALPANLNKQTLPAASILSQLDSRSFIQKLATPRIAPRGDTDLVLWIYEPPPSVSPGYFNPAVPVYIPQTANANGFYTLRGGSILNPTGGAGCQLDATLFDGKSGEMLVQQTFILTKNAGKQEHPDDALRRLLPVLADDIAIVMGLKAGKPSKVYIRDERKTREQTREEFAQIGRELKSDLKAAVEPPPKKENAADRMMNWAIENNKRQWRKIADGPKKTGTAPE